LTGGGGGLYTRPRFPSPRSGVAAPGPFSSLRRIAPIVETGPSHVGALAAPDSTVQPASRA